MYFISSGNFAEPTSRSTVTDEEIQEIEALVKLSFIINAYCYQMFSSLVTFIARVVCAVRIRPSLIFPIYRA